MFILWVQTDFVNLSLPIIANAANATKQVNFLSSKIVTKYE